MSDIKPISDEELSLCSMHARSTHLERALATELIEARRRLGERQPTSTLVPGGLEVRQSVAVPEGAFWVNPTWLRAMTGMPEPSSTATGPTPDRVVQLTDFATPGVFVWAGWQRGQAVREGMDLDSWDQGTGLLVFVAPEDAISVTPSFWRGLLTPSLKLLTPEEFDRRYAVAGPDHVVRAFTEAVQG